MKTGTETETKAELGGGTSIADLPSTILVEILLKLSVKCLVTCKSVCKAWRGSISDPRFAELHLARAESRILIRDAPGYKLPGSPYFVDRGISGSGCCLCRWDRGQSCERCRSDRDPEDATFCLETVWEDDNLIWLLSRKWHCYSVANSSNGFICLVEPWRNDKPDSVCVCNPVTGEFTYLPPGGGGNNDGVEFRFGFGFGFSPKHNQYKVIRMSARVDPIIVLGEFGYGKYALEAEIHTLGTDSWRTLDISGFDTPVINSPCYLNGSLYWSCVGFDQCEHLFSFDVGDERFRVHSIPSLPGQKDSIPRLGLAALDGCLYVYTYSAGNYIDIWVANECGSSVSCTPLFSIDIPELDVLHRRFPYQLVCFLNDGTVVLFGGPGREFIYYDQSKGLRFEHPEFRGVDSDQIEIVHLTPSLVSLKDVTSSGQ